MHAVGGKPSGTVPGGGLVSGLSNTTRGEGWPLSGVFVQTDLGVGTRREAVGAKFDHQRHRWQLILDAVDRGDVG